MPPTWKKARRSPAVETVGDAYEAVAGLEAPAAAIGGPVSTQDSYISTALLRQRSTTNSRSQDAELLSRSDNTGSRKTAATQERRPRSSRSKSVFTGLRRARKRQRITTRRARDFRTRRAASVTVRTYPQRDNANEPRRTSATAWRGVALNALAYAAAAFELLDFPPILGLLDAHALWHASTAPLGHLLWVYFVEVDGVPPDDQTAALES